MVPSVPISDESMSPPWTTQNEKIEGEKRRAGAPYGVRTRVSAVKGRRPSPLDEGSAVAGNQRALSDFECRGLQNALTEIKWKIRHVSNTSPRLFCNFMGFGDE